MHARRHGQRSRRLYVCLCARSDNRPAPSVPSCGGVSPGAEKSTQRTRLLALAVELVCQRSLSLSCWVLTHPPILIESLLSRPRDKWKSRRHRRQSSVPLISPVDKYTGLAGGLRRVGRAIRLGASWTTWSRKVWHTRQWLAGPADSTARRPYSPLPKMSRPNRPGRELYHPIPGTPGITPGTPIPNGIGMPIGTPMPPMGIPIMPM